MPENQEICRKCILPKGFLGLDINSKGLCNFCVDSEYKVANWGRKIISNETRNSALSDWNSVIEKMKLNHKKMKYDCVIGFSGGKDSTALLYKLINEYKITPLAITTDTGFMTEIAKNNIKNTLEKVNVDHIFIKDCIPTFTKLYRFLFFNHLSNEILLSRDVCDYCSDLIHSIVVKEAIKYNIPFVLFAYSPDQIARYYYEIPQKEIKNDWTPKFLFQEPFDATDLKWYLLNKEILKNELPRVLLPYHVINYKEENIIELVESKNLIKKGHADPLLTNCNVVHAAQFYDMNRYGGILYAYQYAELVRQDPQLRDKWLEIFKQAFPLILENNFKREAVNKFFDKIGTSEEDILEYIQTLLSKDPNNKSIEENIKKYRK